MDILRFASRSVFLAAAAAILLAACNGEPSGVAAAPGAILAPTAGTTDLAPARADDALDWDSLAAHLGQYPPELDLDRKGEVGDALRDLLGERFDTLVANLKVAGPLARENGVYYLTGNAQHEGGVNQAYVLFEPSGHALEVGLWQKGSLRVFATPGALIPRPTDVDTMIANAEESAAPEAR